MRVVQMEDRYSRTIIFIFYFRIKARLHRLSLYTAYAWTCHRSLASIARQNDVSSATKWKIASQNSGSHILIIFAML